MTSLQTMTAGGVRGWDNVDLLWCLLLQEEERCITNWFMEFSVMDSVLNE